MPNPPGYVCCLLLCFSVGGNRCCIVKPFIDVIPTLYKVGPLLVIDGVRTPINGRKYMDLHVVITPLIGVMTGDGAHLISY